MGLTTTKELFWTDSGAPAISGTAGSFRVAARDFLEDCGWTVVWENAGAQVVVLRNSLAVGGSGAFVRIDDSNAQVATFVFYESMSDIDTGTAPTQTYSVVKASSAGGTPRPYQLIGDERTFYGAILGGNTSVPPAESTAYYGYTSVFGGGDYIPAIVGDPGIFGTGRTNTGQYYDNELYLIDQTSSPRDAVSTTRNASLTAETTNIAILNNGAYGGATLNHSGNETGQAFKQSSDRLYTPVYFYHGTMGAGAVLRGKARGIMLPMNHMANQFPLIGGSDTPYASPHPKTLRIIQSGCVRNSKKAALAFHSGEWDNA